MTVSPAFTFLSSLRRGLAAGIAQVDSGAVPGHVSVTATATTSAGAAAPVDLRLMGPGEVTGVDNRVILRTFPKPNETSHPPNLYVTLELDRPELPWLFTPAKAGADDRLRPWLGLVVVEAIGGNQVTSDASKPLPNLHVDDGAQLPDPADSWAWAHVAVSGSLSDPAEVEGLLTTNPERVIARLMCPRRLDGMRSYIAALVPLFEGGRAAGSGDAVDDTANLAPAWQAGSPADLPVYYHWEFSTGPVGDFRSLALLLHHAPPAGSVGSRPMDITNPGGGLPPLAAGAVTKTLGLGGAMRVPGADSSDDWDATERDAFETLLTDEIDTANLAAAGLGPPLYGRWLAAQTTVPGNSSNWLYELNLDPRHRVAAGLGALVVSNQHEALMAQAWAQVGDVERANAALRQAQLARQHLRPIYTTLLPGTSDGTFLLLTSPLHDRVRLGPLTARGVVAASSFPEAALSSAFRRISRPRGRFGRRLGRSGDQGALVERLASGALAVAPPPAAPDGTPIAAPPGVRLKPQQITSLPGFSGWKPLAEDDTLPAHTDHGPDSPEAAAFRGAAAAWATWLQGFEQAPQPASNPALDTGALRGDINARIDPNVTVARRTRSLVAVGTWDGAGDDLEPVLAAPRFPQPMWEPLRALSQQYVLPGIETMEPNSLMVAEPNAEFIEAYMVGLNHEIGRLLLFAEFPTDQRGTCFRQFWDPRGQVPAPAPGTTDDIGAIDGWKGGELGSHLATADLDMLVLLIRGDLLHRYPDLAIYAAPAVWTGAVGTHTRAPDPDPKKELYPLFRGSLAPDITFVCFSPLDPGGAKGALVQSKASDPAGWFFVLQQHSTEPHFGLGAALGAKQGNPADPNSITWDDFADANGNLPDFAPVTIPSWWTVSWGSGPRWGSEAAATAALSLQQPVRVAFHASELLP